jgi:hypothetical protein
LIGKLEKHRAAAVCGASNSPEDADGV